MNRPRRPTQVPPRRRPSGAPPSSGPGGGPPRRRTPLDNAPQTLDPPLKVLGTGVDRHALMASAEPLELVVMQGFTREIEEAFHKYKGRYEDFWDQHPHLVERLRKVDEVLAGVQKRKSGG
jgi:hypothetical protein